MLKKVLIIASAMLLTAALAACSTIQSMIGGQTQSNQANSGQSANGQNNSRGGFGGDPASMTVEQKLGFAILKMEGSPTGLTADQAKAMLPLWQALKTMETSNTTSADEINAIFTQMKETLTPEQVSAVEKLTWTQEELQSVMQQYGMQFGGPGGQGAPNGTLSPEQLATRQARFQQNGGNRQGGNRQGGGNFPPGGAPPDGGPGGQGGFGGGNGTTQNGSTATLTPSPAQLNRRIIGFNSLFINPVIQLLTTKSGS